MTRVRALVVGIDSYSIRGWNIPRGPAMMARRIAGWLLGLPGIDLELHVFMTEGDEYRDLASLDTQGRLRLHGEPTDAAVEAFVKGDLQKDVAVGTRLFVYWSGHGATCAITGHRLFMCCDYDEHLDTRCFNASLFLLGLDALPFRKFASHIVFADVCATFMSPQHTRSSSLVPSNGQVIPRLVYFAGAPGTYTKNATAGGKFSEMTLAVLKAMGAYPEPAHLAELAHRLEQTFDKDKVPWFRHSSWGQDQRGGLSASEVQPALPFRAAAEALIAGLDADANALLDCYRRTANNLCTPVIADAGALDAIVEELCSLRDGLDEASTTRVPYGLLQFVLRLAELPNLDGPINLWLGEHAAGQLARCASIKKLLDAEKQRKSLLLAVREQGGQIAGIQPYLCLHDGSFDPSYPSREHPVRTWSEAVRIVQACIAPFIRSNTTPNLHVEFAVEANLLDLPFHQIPLCKDGPPLGARVRVVLRDRQRMMCGDPWWLERWREYAHALRCQKPQRIKWLKIDASGVLPKDRGICFAGFSLQSASTAALCRERANLSQLLFDGAPVLYLRQSAPPDGDWVELQTRLASMSAGAKHFDGVADVFHRHRFLGAADAADAALLWDDPDTNPFP